MKKALDELTFWQFFFLGVIIYSAMLYVFLQILDFFFSL